MERIQTESSTIDLTHNFEAVRQRVAEAAHRSARSPENIQIVAISKTHGAELMQQALRLGVRALGENRVQEAREKFPEIEALLKEKGAQYHLVGHLQTNKAKEAVRLFDLIQSVDSERLARELDHRAQDIGKVQRVLIEVNSSKELTKFGVEPTDLMNLFEVIRSLNHLCLEGLMTIGPLSGGINAARACFRDLRNLWHMLGGVETLPILSMGMTQDFETAIEEGATMIRVGTAIFGMRQ